MEEITGKKFGDNNNPLLVSVRSGAPVSMPGMMDTILNLGLNDVSVQGLAAATGDARFAKDCYRRFIQMFADVVMNVESHHFENVLERIKEEITWADHQLTLKCWMRLFRSKSIINSKPARSFPEPYEQLLMAVKAVLIPGIMTGQGIQEDKQYSRRPEQLSTFRPWYLETWAMIRHRRCFYP